MVPKELIQVYGIMLEDKDYLNAHNTHLFIDIYGKQDDGAYMCWETWLEVNEDRPSWRFK